MSKILIVDDDADIVEAMRLVLEKSGHKVSIAVDGNEGLDKARTGKPDVIILDVMMPGIDGYEVCRRVRASGKKAPILMLTARTSEVDTVVGLELGANDYITKPVRLRELVARVKAHLREMCVKFREICVKCHANVREIS